MALYRNVGSVDRAIRAIVGAVALALAFTTLGLIAGSPWGIIAGAAGLIMLGAAAMGVCPLYVPLGLSTCGIKPR